jgi:hypothetical protein
MYDRATRLVLVFMAIPGLLVGLWAAFAPRSFYDDFPGAGREWVSPDGPYNEHLVRDVGVLFLALVVVTIAALVWLTPPLVRATAWGWLIYGVPHLVYHVRHRDVYDAVDQVSNLFSLLLAPVLAMALLVLSNRLDARMPERAMRD